MNDDMYDPGRLAEFVVFFLSEDQTKYINRQRSLRLLRAAEGGTFGVPPSQVDKIEGFLILPDMVNHDARLTVDTRSLYAVNLLVNGLKRLLRRAGNLSASSSVVDGG